ncbi:hypothetical protein BT69DRAFT_1212814 [Atractiella rhizophila]|nr:hypothetical protein BT69DRAFT_1212814 [Atractiella rhizophila]
MDRQYALTISKYLNSVPPGKSCFDATFLNSKSGLGKHLDSGTARQYVNATSTQQSRPEQCALYQSLVVGRVDGKIRDVKCVACIETIRKSQAVQFPCSHYYDRQCFNDLFAACLKDESLLPLRCCNQAMLRDEIQQHVMPEQFRQYESKLLEHDTTNRLYCANPKCSTFLGTASGQKERRGCVTCGQQVCARCKAAWTMFHFCVQDEQEAVLLKIANEEKWKRCQKCYRMVELQTGCYHMTCLCKNEFCYHCGSRWGTCHCPLWSEDRLVERAEEQVRVQRARDRDPTPQPQPHAEFEQHQRQASVETAGWDEEVQQAADRLRANEDCQHQQWRMIYGERRCQSCERHMPNYLLICSGCQFLACVRCQRNRL